MDLSLEDKVTLFDRLKSLEHEEDHSDNFEPVETEHRAKCRAFSQLGRKKPGLESRSTFAGVGNRPKSTHRRTVSESNVKSPTPTGVAQPDIIIIDDTPPPMKVLPGQPRLASLLRTVSHPGDTPIPDTARRPFNQPNQRASNPQLRKNARSSPVAKDSPSVTMGKRKRPAKLKMAPEALQYFKGLSFFYIPNSDINPARERRITRAREYGAAWVRSLDQATHVIVDAELSYAGIEKTLAGTANPLGKIIVQDTYPLECITYRMLLNPDQEKYKVRGFVQTVPRQMSDMPQASQTSDTSLKLKEPKSRHRKNQSHETETPPRADHATQESSQPSADKVISVSQLGSQVVAIEAANQPDRMTVPTDIPIGNGAENEPLAFEGRLAQCIEFARANPHAESDAQAETGSDNMSTDTTSHDTNPDGEGGSSEDERHRKRQRRVERVPETANRQEKFACMNGGTKDDKSDNPNADTIAMLQPLCDWYSRNNDHWRTTSYRKAISALRQQPTKMTTAEDAKTIRGIGDRIAKKIEEIVQTGRLKRLEEASNDPGHQVRELFLKIYDVGLYTAEKWMAQGHKTLEDLLEKATITQNQRIGIEHYEDFNTRIPRIEVEALGARVKKVAHEIDSRVELLIGGSYRRGSDSSGDIDLIVTKKGTTTSEDLGPFLGQLVQKLTKDGFLTAGLATSGFHDGGNKWHGCCVLPKDDFPGDKAQYKPIWRRIDFLLVPETEFGAALIYFTGNDLFNRSLRLLAGTKGMCLNHRGLFQDVMRGPARLKYNDGVLVEGRDEKKIFEALGVRWMEPHQRWC